MKNWKIKYTSQLTGKDQERVVPGVDLDSAVQKLLKDQRWEAPMVIGGYEYIKPVRVK